MDKTANPAKPKFNSFMMAFVSALKDRWDKTETEKEWEEVLEEVMSNHMEEVMCHFENRVLPYNSVLDIAQEIFPKWVEVKVHIIVKKKIPSGASYESVNSFISDEISVVESRKKDWDHICEQAKEKWAGSRSISTGHTIDIVEVFPVEYESINL